MCGGEGIPELSAYKDFHVGPFGSAKGIGATPEPIGHKKWLKISAEGFLAAFALGNRRPLRGVGHLDRQQKVGKQSKTGRKGCRMFGFDLISS